jgi:hypothetical protein
LESRGYSRFEVAIAFDSGRQKECRILYEVRAEELRHSAAEFDCL